MVEIEAVYEGWLRCRLTHGPSGEIICTDAPKDHEGEGTHFAPTDLVAAALGSCVLTTMGIVARRHDIDLAGTTARVAKTMVSEPSRRIGRLDVTVTFVRPIDPAKRELLERAALACPVHHSLHREIEAPVRFVYP